MNIDMNKIVPNINGSSSDSRITAKKKTDANDKEHINANNLREIP